MLENYDTQAQVRALAAEFERDHAAQPYPQPYARGARRVFALLTVGRDASPPDPELLGLVETTLAVVEAVGPESLRFLLSVLVHQGEAGPETD